jgi:hypothetical protein
MSHSGCVFVTQDILTYRHIASSASFALSKELLMQARAPRHPVPVLNRTILTAVCRFERMLFNAL